MAGGIDAGSSPGADFGLTLTSNNDGDDNEITSFTAVATTNLDVIFDWTYQTSDVGGSSFDPFGYFIDSVFVQLSPANVARPALTVGSGCVSRSRRPVLRLLDQCHRWRLGTSLATVTGNIGKKPRPRSRLRLVACCWLALWVVWLPCVAARPLPPDFGTPSHFPSQAPIIRGRFALSGRHRLSGFRHEPRQGLGRQPCPHRRRRGAAKTCRRKDRACLLQVSFQRQLSRLGKE